jgi:hypothetical protein
VCPGRRRWCTALGGTASIGAVQSGSGSRWEGVLCKKVKATGGEVGGKNTKRLEVVGSGKVGSDYKCAYERYKALSIGYVALFIKPPSRLRSYGRDEDGDGRTHSISISLFSSRRRGGPSLFLLGPLTG